MSDLIIVKEGEPRKVHREFKESIVNIGDYIIIGDYVYEFIGYRNNDDYPEGKVIVDEMGSLWWHEYTTEEEKQNNHIDRVRSAEEYTSTISWKNEKVEELVNEYLQISSNLMKGYSILQNTGSIYTPQLQETDDPMERLIKLMIINMNIKLNDKRTSTDKDYDIDNLRSALNGATKNMSISKFLMWCNVLRLDWEFSLINSPESAGAKLASPVTISNTQPLEEDMSEEPEDKKVFYVPLVDGEDPLKRLLKVAIWRLKINLKDYKGKGSAHCINNLRSGLKGKQKMSIQSIMKWCEILDLMLVIKITNPDTGNWYKAIGYEVFTNVQDDEHANYTEG